MVDEFLFSRFRGGSRIINGKHIEIEWIRRNKE